MTYLLGLVTGSEGLLCVVTEVTVKILKKPQTVRAGLIGFSKIEDAGNCVSDIIATGIIPSGMEMMDKALIIATDNFVKAGYPRDTCLKALEFTYKYSGNGSPTEKDSTHPGYEDRRKELDQFLEAFKNIDTSKERTKGKWEYDRSLNNLTFIPK